MTAAEASMTAEHFDVLIVGAGLSGIGAGYHLQEKCPGKSYVILEGRDCIGGTWDLFRYPGIRSDSDMFTLGYSFKPWTEPKAIADGPHILNYVRETADRQRHRQEDPLQPSRQARVVVVAGCALDGGGRAHRGRGRDRGRAASPAISCSCARAITNTRKATRRSFRARLISPARSCIRRNGLRISTMPASAWW